MKWKSKKVSFTLYTLNYISKVSWFKYFKNKVLNTLTTINSFKIVIKVLKNKCYGCDYGATKSETN